MQTAATPLAQAGPQDRTSRVLIWIMIIVTVVCWTAMVVATVETYEQAAPLPQKMVTAGGTAVMSYDSIVAGKSGFQKADLMDYGSLYGMGSYFGEDYTAEYLVQLGRQVQENLAQERYGKPYAALGADQQSGITRSMRAELKGIDLSKPMVVLPQAVADAIATLRARIAQSLLTDNFARLHARARAG